MKQYLQGYGAVFFENGNLLCSKEGIRLPEVYLLNLKKAINSINIFKNFYGNDGLF